MKYTLVIAALLVLSFAGCNEGKPTATNATPAASDSTAAKRG